MSIAGQLGANIFPILSGQLLEDNPMILMYLTAATIFLYSILFFVTVFIGKKVDSVEETTINKA